MTCKNRHFKLYQMIVCPQSPVVTAALSGGFELMSLMCAPFNTWCFSSTAETTDSHPNLRRRLPSTIKTTRRRRATSIATTTKCPKDPPASKRVTDEILYQIVSHLRVNTIADYYGIAKLAKLSTSKIELILKKRVGFLIIPQIIAEMSHAIRDSEIRSVIAPTTARYIEELASSQIIEAYGQRIQQLTQDLSAANEVIRKLEGERDLTAAQVRAVIQQLLSTSKCRNCKKDF
ncbi:hypothetical protein LB504_008013 [Fusarium proliferatum]|nr:hypothetical protein LB504_008013 [Fusarium proliferatum]